MLKYEFEKLYGAEVSAEDYKLIEHIYMYHPLIPEVDGKRKIVEIYKVGGMMLMRDMKPLADKSRDHEMKIQSLRNEIQKLREQIEEENCEFDKYVHGDRKEN